MNHFMLSKILCITMFISFLGLASCGGGSQSQAQKGPKPFVMPTIPAIMTDPQDRANFLAGHYWDHFDFKDTSVVGQPQVAEQAFANYIEILPHVTPSVASASIQHVLSEAQAEPKVFTFFKDLFEKYLYDPNSPMRNEELYLTVLEHMIDLLMVDGFDKGQISSQLESIRLNRPGQIATDFVYTLPTGRQGRMHDIKSEFLVIFFNNPGCTSCGEIQYGFEQSQIFKEMQDRGRLKILAMYVDEDFVAWEEHRTSMPAHWINGYDASLTIRKDKLYDLRAIPNLYLLDKDKRVILRDTPPQRLEEFLYYQLQGN